MAVTPHQVDTLPKSKLKVVIMLQLTLDMALCERGSNHQAVTIKLERGRYDVFVLRAIHENYAPWWQLTILDEDGALAFTFIPQNRGAHVSAVETLGRPA